VDVAKKDLIIIINEEIDKMLNEAPDFTRRRPRFSDDDTTDIISKKNLASKPDFKKRAPAQPQTRTVSTPRDALIAYGIGEKTIEQGKAKIIQVYYMLRSKSMPRVNPEIGKIPDGVSNPDSTTPNDKQFLKTLSAIYSDKKLLDLPLPFEEIDQYDNRFGDKFEIFNVKKTQNQKLHGRLAYFILAGDRIRAVMFGG
jgi:hypothetical protein